MKQRSSEKGMALVITLMMLAIVTFMAVVFLATSRRERVNVKTSEDMILAKSATDIALAQAQAQILNQIAGAGEGIIKTATNRTRSLNAIHESIASGLVQRAKLSYDLSFSKAYINDTGFAPQGAGNVNIGNVSYWDKSGKPLQFGSSDFIEDMANLYQSPSAPVFVTTSSNTLENRWYLDLNRNGIYDTNGFLKLDKSGTILGKGVAGDPWFVGDPEWVGVLENPNYPHSETNRFVSRWCFLVLPMGKSLDQNFIHNASKYTGNATDITAAGSHYARNQGVGSFELNMAAYLRELNTNVWRSGTAFYSYSLNNPPAGTSFADAAALLRYRLNNSRGNLFTPFQALTNKAIPTPIEGIRFTTQYPDYVDAFGDGPYISYENWYTNGFPIAKGVLKDDDDEKKFWHAQERVDKTQEYPDIQKVFQIGTSYKSDFNAFFGRYRQAVSTNSNNAYDRYGYYRWLSQMGYDSTPALANKIHLNFTNEPGTLATNLYPWVTKDGPAYLGRPAALITNLATGAIQTSTTNSLTNFFLIAADAMLKASIVTNVYRVPDSLYIVENGKTNYWRTNYTIGGPFYVDPGYNSNPTNAYFWNNGLPPAYLIANYPVRPEISITNIQIYHILTNSTKPRATINLAATNNEYSAALHRVLQVAANIYDNMTNRGTLEPYYPSVFRPLYTHTQTNVIISGWQFENNAFAATNHPWATGLGIYQTTPLGLVTNFNVYGQPWVIGAKKGWPNFNEFSQEQYVQVTRKLEILKNKATPANKALWQTNQIFMLGVSNRFAVEAWNSYSKKLADQHPIRIETRVASSWGFHLVTNFVTRAGTPMLDGVSFTNLANPANYVVTGWPGLQSRARGVNESIPPNKLAGGRDSDFRLPIYQMATVLTNSQVVLTNYGAGPTVAFVPPDKPVFEPLSIQTELRLVTTNRFTYIAIDQRENRIIDLATLDQVNDVDIWPQLYNVGQPPPIRGRKPGAEIHANTFDDTWWNTNRATTNATSLVTEGILNQIMAMPLPLAASDPMPKPLTGTAVVVDDWKRFSQNANIEDEYKKFWDFLYNPTNTLERMQAPFSPSRILYVHTTYEANDPLVHYTATDLGGETTTEILRPPTWAKRNDDIGRVNARYRPWGQQKDGDPYLYDSAYKDPAIGGSDDWEFPIAKLDDQSGAGTSYGISKFNYRFANIGDLGRVHRGTPWQTIYLKAPIAPMPLYNNAIPRYLGTNWVNWSGSWGTHPANDWKLVGLFTTAMTESSARGLLSVNQSGYAAWAAVLGGVQVITNTTPDAEFATQRGNAQKHFSDLVIEPGSIQFRRIVDNINAYRATRAGGVFGYLGEILGTPALSWAATGTNAQPYLNPGNPKIPAYNGIQLVNGMTDEALEAIPRRILSLLKEDEPRMVIYAFGQTLKPAPGSFVTDPNYYNLCINYQVTGEYAVKAVMRVDGEVRNPNNPLRTVIESFEQLPPWE